MYNITATENGVIVAFNADFDYSTVKQILYKELMRPNFDQMNDIWLIGSHRANLRLGDIQSIVEDFSKIYPVTASTKKMAFVAEPGLTSAILQLLSDGLDRKMPFSCRIFHSIKPAEEWTGTSASLTA